MQILGLQEVVRRTRSGASALFDDDDFGPGHVELTRGSPQGGPRSQSSHDIFKVVEVVGEYADHVYEETEETSVNNIIYVLRRRECPMDRRR